MIIKTYYNDRNIETYRIIGNYSSETNKYVYELYNHNLTFLYGSFRTEHTCIYLDKDTVEEYKDILIDLLQEYKDKKSPLSDEERREMKFLANILYGASGSENEVVVKVPKGTPVRIEYI